MSARVRLGKGIRASRLSVKPIRLRNFLKLLGKALRARHIVAWKDDIRNRLNPRNGLCLAATQDAAFDRHLITLDQDLRLVLSKRLRDHCTHDTLRENFLRFEGNRIAAPERFTPDLVFVEWHRERFEAQ